MSRSRFGDLLDRAGRLQATAIFLSEDEPGLLRVQGAVLPLPDDPPWSSGELREVIRSLVQANPRRKFEERGHLEFSYLDKRGATWVGSATRSDAGLSMTFRSFAPPAPEKQPLPAPFLLAATGTRGWAWVAGRRGSGKTSILERCLVELSQKRSAHVMILERGVKRIRPPKKGLPLLLEHHAYETNADLVARLKEAEPDVLLVDDLDGGEALLACAELASQGRLVISTHGTSTLQQALVHAILTVPRSERRRFRELVARRFSVGLLQVLTRRNTGGNPVPSHELVMGGDALARFLRAEPFAPSNGGLPGREMEVKDGLLNLVQRAVVHPACALTSTPQPGSLRRALAASGYDIETA
ncbi:MAG: hypothetical protein JKY65_01095, partial [Planctomycetes bacterium]|nr:hypothetical protein [Planctomycetota bacterium]